jgi:hypothetical protein
VATAAMHKAAVLEQENSRLRALLLELREAERDMLQASLSTEASALQAQVEGMMAETVAGSAEAPMGGGEGGGDVHPPRRSGPMEGDQLQDRMMELQQRNAVLREELGEPAEDEPPLPHTSFEDYLDSIQDLMDGSRFEQYYEPTHWDLHVPTYPYVYVPSDPALGAIVRGTQW